MPKFRQDKVRRYTCSIGSVRQEKLKRVARMQAAVDEAEKASVGSEKERPVAVPGGGYSMHACTHIRYHA